MIAGLPRTPSAGTLARSAPTTPAIMYRVAAALVPGILAMTWWFGTAVLLKLASAIAFALVIETLCLALRGRRRQVVDGSAVVTASLIALAAGPSVSYAGLAFAVAAALVLGKHAFGGLGHNPFNPAMVGYAMLLMASPADLAGWPALDGVSGATPLDTFAHRNGATVAEVWHAYNGFGHLGGLGWEWINAAFALGGAYLVWQRLASWRVVCGVLAGLVISAAAGYGNGGSASLGSPAFHLLTGGTMLAVFFVATDPVTHPRRPAHQWQYGLVIGVLVWAIRSFGAYPDGFAFAVLLANAATPWWDRWESPRLHPAHDE